MSSSLVFHASVDVLCFLAVNVTVVCTYNHPFFCKEVFFAISIMQDTLNKMASLIRTYKTVAYNNYLQQI
uniref:Putative secreted protein n=1 Tax=Anopheles darlingi TaxID=43151 RepID=A0A2M4DAW5_ANODA